MMNEPATKGRERERERERECVSDRERENMHKLVKGKNYNLNFY